MLISTNENENVQKINNLVHANRRLTVREIAEEVSISTGSCHENMTAKLKVHRVAAKFVPRLMTEEQKENLDVCRQLLEQAKDDESFMQRIITGEESWVYGYDIYDIQKIANNT